MTLLSRAALRRSCSLLFLLAAFGGTAAGQTILSGNVSNSSTGPLQSGVIYHVPASITVPEGESLTVEPGVILKFNTASTVFVRGTLQLGGVGQPVICTSLLDDSAGGDTPLDGPTLGAPGQWRGFNFFDTSVGSTINNLELRFGGQAGLPGISMSASPVSVTSSTIRDCQDDGINFHNLTTGSTVTGCLFQDNGGYPLNNVALADLGGFSANSAAGHGQGNVIRISNAALAADLSVHASSQINGALLIAPSITVPDGISLTLNAGVVLKPSNVAFTIFVRGPLICNGTAANPVVITSQADDSIAGDTNNDGPSVGAPGHLRGLVVYDTSVGTQLDHLTVRFGGQAGLAGIGISTSGIQLTNSIIEDCQADAIHLNNLNPTGLSITNNVFRNNGGHAVDGVALMAVPSFMGNSASGNGAGNHLHVTNTGLTDNLVLGPEYTMNAPLVVVPSLTIPEGLRLELQAGLQVKWMNAAATIFLRGELDVTGTEANPVVLTTIADDAIGGDTNLDGALTLPMAGSWRGIVTYSTLVTSEIEFLEMRFGGQAGLAGIVNQTPGLTMRWVVIRNFQADGFNLSSLDAGSRGLCAINCGSEGFRLTGGSFDLDRTAAYGCGVAGYKADPAFSGTVVNSIGWGNPGVNFQDFAPGELRYSNGDATLAGMDGNLNVDPMFANAPMDLGLLSGSPCIDAGDPLSTLDADGTTADMGCKSFDHCGGGAYCVGKVNSQGCTPYISLSGTASSQPGQVFDIQCNDVINQKNGLFFYGVNGSQAVPLLGGTLCVVGPLTRTSVVNSGGNSGAPDCSGVFHYDFNALIQSGADPLLVPGTRVWGQYWYRDPASPIPSGLSNAVEFVICD